MNRPHLSPTKDIFRTDEHPDYHQKGPVDEVEEELAEEEQCPSCGAEIMVEGTCLVCSESCGWFEEYEENAPILGEG